MDSSAGPTCAVVFTTKTPYQLPSQKFMIPASWKRYQLSQLINKSLSLPKPTPFDFLIKNAILRTSLSVWCAENRVGEVCVLIFFIEDVAYRHVNNRKKLWKSSISNLSYLLRRSPTCHTTTGCLRYHANCKGIHTSLPCFFCLNQLTGTS
jgi:hypothetical protein